MLLRLTMGQNPASPRAEAIFEPTSPAAWRTKSRGRLRTESGLESPLGSIDAARVRASEPGAVAGTGLDVLHFAAVPAAAGACAFRLRLGSLRKATNESE